jgi:hypothetical protein
MVAYQAATSAFHGRSQTVYSEAGNQVPPQSTAEIIAAACGPDQSSGPRGSQPGSRTDGLRIE